MKNKNTMEVKTAKDELWEKLLNKIENGKEEKQSESLMKCIKLLTKEATTQNDEGKFSFPEKHFLNILLRLRSNTKDQENLIGIFKKNLDYPDILFHFWKFLPKFMPRESQTDFCYKNFLELVNQMALPKNCEKENCFENNKTFCGTEEDFKWDYQIVKRILNKVWNRSKSWNLSPSVHKKLLLVLIERIMQHLEKPILWTDFLMDSLNVPGAISFLALQGVFILVTKFNIEVPQIYNKLYEMFQPEIFHSKYKQRLFYLTDIFMTSTHLPGALVASFAKRLSRLALIAPPEDIIIILMLVGNLIMRHPELKCMIHKTGKGEVSIEITCNEDPFLETNGNPLETRAIESSLWEIRTLENHVLPHIATMAKFIRQPLPNVQFDMAEKLEETGSDIFERELKKKAKNFEVALNFERPNSMTLPLNEKVTQYWDLTI